jgi:NAD-dependent DNA ligase
MMSCNVTVIRGVVCRGRFIYGLGVRQVGLQTAGLLAEQCGHDVQRFLACLRVLALDAEPSLGAGAGAEGVRLLDVSGIGPTVVAALTDLASVYNALHSLTH